MRNSDFAGVGSITQIHQKANKNIEFHFQDFMETDVENLFKGKARVVANIPYYITTPIIFRLVENLEKFSSILVLIQKEVAERFASLHGAKDYGITSVILQSIFDVSIPGRWQSVVCSRGIIACALGGVISHKYTACRCHTRRDAPRVVGRYYKMLRGIHIYKIQSVIGIG